MKTRDEVESLKQSWLRDDCWDLEDTSGFEEYREELREFAAKTRGAWEERRLVKIREKAAKMGCGDNLALAEYLLGLEERVADLEQSLEATEDSCRQYAAELAEKAERKASRLVENHRFYNH